MRDKISRENEHNLVNGTAQKDKRFEDDKLIEKKYYRHPMAKRMRKSCWHVVGVITFYLPSLSLSPRGKGEPYNEDITPHRVQEFKVSNLVHGLFFFLLIFLLISPDFTRVFILHCCFFIF